MFLAADATPSFSIKSLETPSVYFTLVRHVREMYGNKMAVRDFSNLCSKVYGLGSEESKEMLRKMSELGLIIHIPPSNPTSTNSEDGMIITKPEEVYSAIFGKEGREAPLQRCVIMIVYWIFEALPESSLIKLYQLFFSYFHLILFLTQKGICRSKLMRLGTWKVLSHPKSPH